MSFDSSEPVNQVNPHYMVFMGKGEKPSFTNKAYDGIYMQEGKKYLLSFYARLAEGTKEVRVSVRKDGKIAAETEILALQAGWNKYETVLTAKMDVKQADFVVSLEGEGTVCFDFFSLMPEDAVLHVFRRDLTERLKELKQNIDVLTMTATPIPRTLHMAMTGVRDMSVLSEPPENRYPVQTYVLEDNPAVIADAVRNELSRGGQVFYLYNRVQGIYRKAEWIRSMFPDITVAVGHGKMKEDELEDIMYDMVNGKTDVLVCTTIIETGLDIPNANTIIIENADKMGLSQLYQLRGRVGRSNRAAYAYLTYHRDKILSDVASKRLRAVKEFTEFGSGFKIAMRDLEIRGAGNILGPEQHGHMDAVGYDMYCKLLKESVDEAQGIKIDDVQDAAIDINIDAYLPESYIRNHNQRIDIYKKIAAIETEDDKFEIEDELIDRFGDIPRAVQNIIEVASLKTYAKECGIYEIAQSGDNLLMKFGENYVDANLIMGLDKMFPKRIKLLSGDKPVISYAIKGEYKKILNIVNNLLSTIKELQSAEKDSIIKS